MVNKLIEDIKTYIQHLRELGLFVSVHGDISDYILSAPKINIHDNPFCIFVKSDSCAWDRCIESQNKIYEKNCTEPFWGMCHAGIEEYVFPIYNSKIFGFVSVSGYAVNKTTAAKRISALSKEFMLNQNELLRVYESLNHQKPDIDKLSVIINPLVQMLILLNMLQPPVNAFDGGDNRIYNKALRFIERNYMEKITINNIAEYCSCSVSSISHIFPRKCGQTVKQYINSLRISQAKHLLSSSMLAIKTISALCGFEEPDYFSTVFKNYTGISPSGYRKTR